MVLETDPDLAPWAWYSGAYHQYHSVLFPLSQVCVNPHLPDTERIMAMAEYVFGPTLSFSNPQKRAVSIMRAVKDNLKSFLFMLSEESTSRLSMMGQLGQDRRDTTGLTPGAHDHIPRGANNDAFNDAEEQRNVDIAGLDLGSLGASMEESEIWWRWQPDLMDLLPDMGWDGNRP